MTVEFTVGQHVRDIRDGREYTVMNLNPCGKKDCGYIGCWTDRNGLSMTIKLKTEFLEPVNGRP